jgi:hypothetical protein
MPRVPDARRSVYVTVTTTTTADEPIENATVVAEEMERWLSEMEGFEGFLLLAGEERALGLAFWASKEVAERYNPVRSQFRERMLAVAGVQIEDIVDYEVAFARFGPALAEGV